MPTNIIQDYKPPIIFRNKHIHTIVPALFRKVKQIPLIPKTIVTPDNDFIDFDYYPNNSKTAFLILHGLEGNSRKPYMLGMIRVLHKAGYDVFGINLKGCSGRHNSLFTSYHAGKTDDLEFMTDHVINEYGFQNIILMGFSIGGNITLKFVGEKAGNIKPQIRAAIGISVPCHLSSTSEQMSKRANFLYLTKFIRSLKRKAIYKINTFNINYISQKEVQKAKSFYQFDNLFTAPVHGFKNAENYWENCSSKAFMKNISIPTLLINALDDPFLTPECYPYQEAIQNPNLYLEVPKFGGHVGFINSIKLKKVFWHEKQVIAFIDHLNSKNLESIV